MKFYPQQHQFTCRIDLHAKTMYVCILDQAGEVVVHRNLRTTPDRFLKTIAPYREDVVVAVVCIFTWTWLPRSLHPREHSLRLGSCPVHESHPRRQGQE